MFPDLSNTDTLRGALFALFVVIAVGFLIVLLTRARHSELPLRKLALYVAFFVLGIAFLFGEPLFTWLSELAYGVSDAPGAVNASGAVIAAHAKVGGWVPVGTATSKLVLAASFYVLTWLLPWLVQQATHPGLTAWAKDDYTANFGTLSIEEKFAANRGLSYSQSIRIAASILGACLIQ